MNFFMVLLAIFIAFKLAHVVAWSWLIVFSPVWLPLMLGFIMICFAALLTHPK